MMTPSRARVGDTVRILVHGFQVSLALICWEGAGGGRGPSFPPLDLQHCQRAPVSESA